MDRCLLALTVDVEGSTRKLPARIDLLLSLFADAQAKATFFVLGQIAETAPGVVEDIARAGHEVGFHGYQHLPVSELTHRQLRQQLGDWRKRLQDISQSKVEGYRAPYFSICKSTAWALDVVSEAGFSYDASIFPGMSDRFNWLEAPKSPRRLRSNGLVIFPVPVLSAALPIAFSGGGYLRLLPWPIIRWGFWTQSRRGLPGMIYVHPWEIDPPSGTDIRALGKRAKNWQAFRESLTGRWRRRRMLARLEHLLKSNHRRLATVANVISSIGELPEWDPPGGLCVPQAIASR